MNFLREAGRTILEDDNSYKFILIDKNSSRKATQRINNTIQTSTILNQAPSVNLNNSNNTNANITVNNSNNNNSVPVMPVTNKEPG